MLARQWQTGEFSGEDAGSPLQVRARLERAPLSRYWPGPLAADGVTGSPYNPAETPLEVLVQREEMRPDLQTVLAAGLLFFRLLDQHAVGKYRSAFLSQYPFGHQPEGTPLNAETARLIRIAAGRVPDVSALANDLRTAQGDLPAAPLVEAADRDSMLQATREWLTWFDSAISAPPSEGNTAWNPERMEYSFAVAAPETSGERTLSAVEHTQGILDWYSFDQAPGASIGARDDGALREELVRTAIPGPVSYLGMPAARWWQFEDGQVNFGTVDAGPPDLLRLLLLAFALDYGNDWFNMPVELPAGALYRVKSLVVTDSFGERTLVRPYTEAQTGAARWRMFSLSADKELSTADESFLFLPPLMPSGLQSESVERVVFMRDELANLAWAVERVVEDAGGRPIDRGDYSQSVRPAASAAAAGELAYRLATTVPDYWLPLVPARVDPARPDIRLVRGRVLLTNNTTPVSPEPLGRLLEPGRQLQIPEEEVQREGAIVERKYRHARWTDGSTHLWVGRSKRPGRGEGFSGLRFDVLEGLARM
jgi:hypothetical protein